MAVMPPGIGDAVLAGITDGQQTDGPDLLRQREGFGHFPRVKAAHPHRADAQFLGLQHHLGADDGDIHLAGVVPRFRRAIVTVPSSLVKSPELLP